MGGLASIWKLARALSLILNYLLFCVKTLPCISLDSSQRHESQLHKMCIPKALQASKNELIAHSDQITCPMPWMQFDAALITICCLKIQVSIQIQPTGPFCSTVDFLSYNLILSTRTVQQTLLLLIGQLQILRARSASDCWSGNHVSRPKNPLTLSYSWPVELWTPTIDINLREKSSTMSRLYKKDVTSISVLCRLAGTMLI